LLIEVSFVLFKIFIEHVLSAQLIPTSKVVDSHSGQHSVFLKNPVYLLFIAPHHVPIIVISLFPLPINKSI